MCPSFDESKFLRLSIMTSDVSGCTLKSSIIMQKIKRSLKNRDVQNGIYTNYRSLFNTGSLPVTRTWIDNRYFSNAKAKSVFSETSLIV